MAIGEATAMGVGRGLCATCEKNRIQVCNNESGSKTVKIKRLWGFRFTVTSTIILSISILRDLLLKILHIVKSRQFAKNNHMFVKDSVIENKYLSKGLQSTSLTFFPLLFFWGGKCSFVCFVSSAAAL